MSSEQGAGPDAQPGSPATPSPTAVVIAEDLRARLLLRGLLLMHRVRIEGEADSPRKGVDLAHAVKPNFLILDPSGEETAYLDVIPELRRACPESKILLIRPAVRGYLQPVERERRPDALLREPFTVQELAQALYSDGFEQKRARPVDRDSTT
jgi:DNA-binding NarL/FixJ family response regulator